MSSEQCQWWSVGFDNDIRVQAVNSKLTVEFNAGTGTAKLGACIIAFLFTRASLHYQSVGDGLTGVCLPFALLGDSFSSLGC